MVSPNWDIDIFCQRNWAVRFYNEKRRALSGEIAVVGNLRVQVNTRASLDEASSSKEIKRPDKILQSLSFLRFLSNSFISCFMFSRSFLCFSFCFLLYPLPHPLHHDILCIGSKWTALSMDRKTLRNCQRVLCHVIAESADDLQCTSIMWRQRTHSVRIFPFF